MKGLLLDNFYKSFNSLKILLPFLVLLGILLMVFTDSQLIIYLYIISIFVCTSYGALSSMRQDIGCKWFRYEATLPIKSETIILSRYISYLFWLVIAIVLSALFIAITLLVRDLSYFDFGMQDIGTLYAICIGFSLMYCSIFYMTLYIRDINKVDSMAILSLVLSVFMTAMILIVLGKQNISIQIGQLITVCIAVMVFILSYFVTIMVYRNTELC